MRASAQNLRAPFVPARMSAGWALKSDVDRAGHPLGNRTGIAFLRQATRAWLDACVGQADVRQRGHRARMSRSRAPRPASGRSYMQESIPCSGHEYSTPVASHGAPAAALRHRRLKPACACATRRTRPQATGTVVPLCHPAGDLRRASATQHHWPSKPKLKTTWRDGATDLVLSPLKFMQRLAALVPSSACFATARSEH